MAEHKKIVTTNKRAFFDYQILEKIEAGIALHGCEVKSIRNGEINLKDSFAQVIREELWLLNCYIDPYKEGNRFNGDPTRDRKLLLKKKEIKKLMGKLAEKGWVLIPLQVYFSNNLVKVELGFGKPKKLYDKRDDLKKKDVQREIQRGLDHQ